MERLGQYAWAESPGTRPTVRVCTEVLTLSEPLPQLLDADTTYTSDPLPTGTQLPTSVKEKTRFWYKGLPALPALTKQTCCTPGALGRTALLRWQPAFSLWAAREDSMHLIRSLPAPSTEPQGQAHREF